MVENVNLQPKVSVFHTIAYQIHRHISINHLRNTVKVSITIALFINWINSTLSIMTFQSLNTIIWVNCISMEFILRSLLAIDDWLSACFAIEKIFVVKYHANFNKRKSKLMPKCIIIIIVMIFIMISFGINLLFLLLKLA